jgi:hypothetical protein
MVWFVHLDHDTLFKNQLVIADYASSKYVMQERYGGKQQ